jgi:hypothetical protein
MLVLTLGDISAPILSLNSVVLHATGEQIHSPYAGKITRRRHFYVIPMLLYILVSKLLNLKCSEKKIFHVILRIFSMARQCFHRSLSSMSNSIALCFACP